MKTKAILSGEAHPTFNTMIEVLERANSLWPHQEAMVINDQRLTYSELLRKVKIYANKLHSLNVSLGDHVAICMGNSVEWVIFAYAINWIGAVVIPVNTRFKSDELHYVLNQSDAKVLIIADEFLGIDFIKILRNILPEIDAQLPGVSLPELEHVIVFGSDVPKGAISFDRIKSSETDSNSIQNQINGGTIALMQYTSGTTSFPKGVLLTNQNLVYDAWHVSNRLGLNSTDRYFSGRPLFHVAGTTLSMIASAVSGACYLTTSKFDPPTVIEIMEKENCTMTSANETMFLMLMNDPSFNPSKLKLRGGLAAVGSAVANSLVKNLGMKDICLGYGLSESSPNCALSPFTDDLEQRLRGYAFPLFGLDVKIFEQDTNIEVEVGQSGEICVKGWSVMHGYYKKPDETAKVIDKKGWLHTGDLGVSDEMGRICFIDRLKDIFRVGGENVAPADLENILNSHPEVKQSQVVGVPDDRLQQVAAAYVIKKEGSKLLESDLINWCKERCAGFKVPRYVRFIESFDYIGITASSKIQRKNLLLHAIKDFNLEK